MRIAIAQMRVKAGHIQLNLNEMKRMIDHAILDGADLIVFPEMAVTGYLIGDYYLQKGFVDQALHANQTLLEWSEKIAIVWGNIGSDSEQKPNRDGRFNRTNTAYFAYQKHWVNRCDHRTPGQYIKHCLPDYRFFDDSRYFKSGVDLALELHLEKDALIEPFELTIKEKKHRIGLQVCEDLWSKDYVVDPTDVLIQKKAEFIINISSSPWTLNKEFSRTKRIQEHVSKQGTSMVPILYVNACGLQNNGKNVLMFDGGSTVYSRDGSIHTGLRDDFESELRVVDLNQAQGDQNCDDKLVHALIHGIRYFDEEQLGAKLPWIIGLSGGIDSSVNAALLCLALGKDRVIGYNMASRFNSQKTQSIAAKTAQLLGIRYHDGSIEPLVESTHTTLENYGYSIKESGLAYENIQARLRGHLLSSFASYEQGVICNNGNKVECALGYATLYGDTIGALSPLGDCTKVQIFEIAETLNRWLDKPVIDPVLIPQLTCGEYAFELAPSAELKDKQIDPMKWGYHDWLVQYLTQYPSHSIEEWLEIYLLGEWQKTEAAPFMKAYGLDQATAFIDDILWFYRAFKSGIFKRIQFPPIITVSRGSFGYDYRESQVSSLLSQRSLDLIESIRMKGDHHE